MGFLANVWHWHIANKRPKLLIMPILWTISIEGWQVVVVVALLVSKLQAWCLKLYITLLLGWLFILIFGFIAWFWSVCTSYVLNELHCGIHGVKHIFIRCIIAGCKMVQLNNNNMHKIDGLKALNTICLL
jgi:hypothetical protein